jgi:multimeric flavodoxin WrbA
MNTAIIILGSRNLKGQTANAAYSMKEGMKSKGVNVEMFFLPAMNLENCRQCEDNGWGICLSKGQCTIKDDFEFLVDKIKSVDLVVFATPVYFSDLSESMKSFLDRLRRICSNKIGQSGINGKIAAGICVAGGGGGGSYECSQNLGRILSTCSFDVADIIPVRRQNALMKTDVLKTTGEWLAEQIL